MRVEEKLAALKRVLGFDCYEKGDEVVFFCPKCKHRKKKLSVNLRTDMFHCWVCGWKGKNIASILRLGPKEHLNAYLGSLDGAGGDGVPDAGDPDYRVPVLPEDFRTLSTPCPSNPYWRCAREYVRARGLDDGDILRYKLGYCEDGEYRHRVIVPSFDAEGNLNFFVGRTFFDDWLKYKHGKFNKDIIFNEYLVDWREYTVTLVEGPFDAMVAGKNAIPLLGTELRTDSLLFKTIVKRCMQVELALDADAWDKQVELAELFFRYGLNVVMISVEDDVGSMTKNEFSDYSAHYGVHVDKLSDLMKLRLRP